MEHVPGERGGLPRTLCSFRDSGKPFGTDSGLYHDTLREIGRQTLPEVLNLPCGLPYGMPPWQLFLLMVFLLDFFDFIIKDIKKDCQRRLGGF